MGVDTTIRQALPLGIAVRYEGVVRESPVVGVVMEYLHPSLFSSSLKGMFSLHCLFAHDAMLEVYKGVSGELVHEDRSIVISLLRQFALQLGDKTWSVGLQLVYGDYLSGSSGYFRWTFVISLDPPWMICQFPVLPRRAKGFLASKQALGQLSRACQLSYAVEQQMSQAIMPTQ